MTAKEYLNGYRASYKEIDYINECVKKGSISGEEGQKRKKAVYEKQDSIVKNIFKVSDPMATVLYKRYVLGQSLDDISKGIYYNYAYTRRLHSKGLKEMENILNEMGNS